MKKKMKKKIDVSTAQNSGSCLKKASIACGASNNLFFHSNFSAMDFSGKEELLVV